MNLARIIEYCRTQEYRLHSATYSWGGKGLFKLLSRDARAWVLMATNQQFQFSENEVKEFRDLLRYKYEGLTEDEKRAVLASITLEQHETTHHVDMMITPFGVSYHGRANLEYIKFCDFA
jgi:hypothetical protein